MSRLVQRLVRPLAEPLVKGIATPSQGGGAYDPDAALLFSRMTTEPDGARKTLISDTITAWKAIDPSMWADTVGLWVIAAHASQAARQNWKADEYNLTAVAGPVFTADRGYKGDGAGSYLNTNVTPSTVPGMSQNSVAMGVWPLDDIAGVARRHMGVRDTATVDRIWSIESASDNRFISQVGLSPTLPVNTIGGSKGLFVVVRTGPAAMSAYKDGVNVGSNTSASAILPARPIYIAGFNNSGTASNFSANQYCVGYLLKNPTDLRRSGAHAIILSYLQAIGALA